MSESMLARIINHANPSKRAPDMTLDVRCEHVERVTVSPEPTE